MISNHLVDGGVYIMEGFGVECGIGSSGGGGKVIAESTLDSHPAWRGRNR